MAEGEALATARFQWEEGLRRLEERAGDGLAPVRRRLLDACRDELRRRLGMTFPLSALVDEYDGAQTWFLALAQEVAPGHPDAWDSAVVLDAAFAVFARQASDAGRGR
jgi:hypothetical protein